MAIGIHVDKPWKRIGSFSDSSLVDSASLVFRFILTLALLASTEAGAASVTIGMTLVFLCVLSCARATDPLIKVMATAVIILFFMVVNFFT